MKKIRTSVALVLAGSFLVGPVALVGAPAEKAKPSKAYPLTTCVVSGEKLGDMGKPYVFVHEGREVQLCCKGCLKDFKKDSAKYIKKIEQAEAREKKS